MIHTPDRDSDRQPDADRRFAERLAEHYRPEPFGPARRARFDAGLRERIERRRRTSGWLPALAGAGAALALTWWAWPAATPVVSEPEAQVQLAEETTTQADTTAATDAEDADWERDVLLADVDTSLSEDEYLPDEYVVLAYAFIDGS